MLLWCFVHGPKSVFSIIFLTQIPPHHIVRYWPPSRLAVFRYLTLSTLCAVVCKQVGLPYTLYPVQPTTVQKGCLAGQRSRFIQHQHLSKDGTFLAVLTLVYAL